MNSLKLSLLLLKRDRKNFFFYMITSVITFTILFAIFNIVYDKGLIENLSKSDYSSLATNNTLVVFIVIIIGCYSNEFFMERRKKEIGIQLISGLGIGDLTFFTIMINMFISGVSVVLGIFFGLGLSKILNEFLYSLSGIGNAHFNVTLDGILTSFSMVIINVVLIALLNIGLAHRLDVCDLVRSKAGTYREKKKSKIGNIFLILNTVALLSSILLMLQTKDYNVISVFGFVCIIFLFFFIFKSLPRIFEILGVRTVNKINIIVFKNTKLNLEKNLASLLSILSIVGFLIVTLSGYKDNPYLSVACVGSGILLTILYIICTLYSFNALAVSKKRNFKILSALGYLDEDKKKIIFKETTLYILCVCFLPVLLAIISIYKLWSLNILNISIGIFISFWLIFIILISYAGGYLIYKNIILD
ncbi:MAG: FtsX-like permease family protein [Clostridium sp.]|uniref:FtsX-like permease family protein n=1 Tax=Clostridium sp. TaxID=1506 RepID=UPI003F2A3353